MHVLAVAMSASPAGSQWGPAGRGRVLGPAFTLAQAPATGLVSATSLGRGQDWPERTTSPHWSESSDRQELGSRALASCRTLPLRASVPSCPARALIPSHI